MVRQWEALWSSPVQLKTALPSCPAPGEREAEAQGTQISHYPERELTAKLSPNLREDISQSLIAFTFQMGNRISHL